MDNITARRVAGPNGFEIPSEEEIAELAWEAARAIMAKYPVLAIRLHDVGDLVGEFWVHKRHSLTFRTEAHVGYVRHHVYVFMNFIALNMLGQRRYEPLTWSGIEIDKTVGESGRDYHEVLEGNFKTPQELSESEVRLEALISSIPDDVTTSKEGITYTPREVAHMLSEGILPSEVAEILGVSRSRVSAVINKMREAVTA